MPRLFETTANNNPDTANRVAFGRPGFAALYMTFVNFLTWLANNLRSSSETEEGVIEIANTAEVTTGTDDSKAVTPLKLEQKLAAGALLLTTVLDIGDWNMNRSSGGTISVSIAHGLSDITKLRKVSVMIRDDANAIYTPLNGNSGTPVAPAGGITGVGSVPANITLIVASGGIFDNTNYNQTSYNRGYIVFESLP